MKILSFAGSLRKESSNKKLVREAMRLLERAELARAEEVDLKTLAMPLYDGDVESGEGIPDGILKLGARITEANALIISTPEYNGGVSSVLKNTIDWLSRIRPMPLAGKDLLLMSASPGGWGGVRGLWHSRVPLEALGVHVFPQMMSLPGAETAFDGSGRLTGEREQQLQNLLTAFILHAGARSTLKAA